MAFVRFFSCRLLPFLKVVGGVVWCCLMLFVIRFCVVFMTEVGGLLHPGDLMMHHFWLKGCYIRVTDDASFPGYGF